MRDIVKRILWIVGSDSDGVTERGVTHKKHKKTKTDFFTETNSYIDYVYHVDITSRER